MSKKNTWRVAQRHENNLIERTGLDRPIKHFYQNELKSLIAKATKEIQKHNSEGRPLIRKDK